ncbi:hypothetical protein [Nocardia cyriacigeorgica]|uniref:hypothetical protein n=1 Tax=Nocardia cyriacigeorgica TaxID=135487 RepID=UPI00245696A2|nr:hypothetical protein [Nocardia cyriacigeorgica]
MSTWSLLSGPLPVALTLAAVAGLAWLLTGRRAPASRTVAVCAIAAVAITAGGAYLVRSVVRLIPDALGMSVYACVGLGVFAVLLAGAHVVRRPGG